MPYADNHGVKTFYDTYGEGVPIVFLHPWTTNGYIWYFQVFPFARTNQVIVVDERGHGRSDKPRNGWSIQEHGDRVVANVILSSGTGLGENMPKDAAEAFKNNFEATFSALLEGAVSARTRRERPEILEVMRSHFMVQSNFPKYVFDSAAADPNGVFNWNIKSRLGEIRKPTMVLAGEEDQATPIAANKLLADNIPGARLNVIKDVGHFYQLEKPMEFNAAVKQFIASLNLR